MPLFSLPSPHGIGTLGKCAEDFIDFLKASGQRYWQMLPAGPVNSGGSPYQSFSSYAGNPYFVDLDMLVSDGLLTEDEVRSADFGSDPEKIDYGKLYKNRILILKKAARRGIQRDEDDFHSFASEKRWLHDYALFMALRDHFGLIPWTEWPDEDIKYHRPEACEKWSRELAEDVEDYKYIQLLFFRQWKNMRKAADRAGIKLIGDIPIYVPMDSADVWSEPEWFRLDDNGYPTEVAGVPPDYFSEDGQLWGNPLYDWDRMEGDGYGWWIRRIAGVSELFDVIRIDHFRGLESFYAVKYGEKTARNGRWIKGPGMDLVGRLLSWFPEQGFIAEDLGYQTPELKKLLKDSGLPGMKVLVFAFDSDEPSDFLPHCYIRNCICYTGTHDNSTVAGWLGQADEDELKRVKKYFGLNEEEGYIRGVIRGGMCSAAGLFVAGMQDWLGLDDSARINVPGVPEGNWVWRMKPGAATESLAKEILEMSIRYGRAEIMA